MLTEIGSMENVPAFIEAREGAAKGTLQGFGHRVYKNYDPRAKIIKKTADEVFEVTGKSPLLDIALKLEEVALSDDYFISRKLYPNVDFYSGLIYQAMGFPMDMFTVLFAIPRTSGWLAHYIELLDQDSRISRPRQIYTGHPRPRLRPHRPALSRRPARRGTQATSMTILPTLAFDAMWRVRVGDVVERVARVDHRAQRAVVEEAAASRWRTGG